MATIGLEPVCLAELSQWQASTADRLQVAVRYSAYAVSRTLARDMGLMATGYWPADVRDLRRVVRLLPFTPKSAVNYIDEPLEKVSRPPANG